MIENIDLLASVSCFRRPFFNLLLDWCRRRISHGDPGRCSDRSRFGLSNDLDTGSGEYSSLRSVLFRFACCLGIGFFTDNRNTLALLRFFYCNRFSSRDLFCFCFFFSYRRFFFFNDYSFCFTLCSFCFFCLWLRLFFLYGLGNSFFFTLRYRFFFCNIFFRHRCFLRRNLLSNSFFRYFFLYYFKL